MAASQRVKTLIGTRNGRLTVVRFVGTIKRQQKDRLRVIYLFECKCDCGTIKNVSGACINPKGTLSCGCLQRERAKEGHEKQKGVARPHVQKPNGYSVLHTSYLTYRNAAKKKNRVFELTEPEFEVITAKDCVYCGAKPRLIKKKSEFTQRHLNGIDRLDSNKGYILENCVACCTTCNFMKFNFTLTEWFAQMVKILEFVPKGKI